MENITEQHILFQDEHIIVINKPINLAIHKNDFMARDADYVLKEIGDLLKRRIYNVHRLDAKTSGVLVLAFSPEDAATLAKQFEQRTVNKTYFAIVRENPGEGVFDTKVLHQSKRKKVNAVTHYKTIESVTTSIKYREFENINLSLVEAKPDTGRWHQIRQHFASQRFDIIGDTKHGDFALNKIVKEQTEIDRLFLHASALEFTHPITNERVTFEAPLPTEFQDVLAHFKAKAEAGEVIEQSPKK